MDSLKLAALDEKDLEIVSAHVQDAVMKVGEMEYLPAAKRFVLPMNRYAWEVKSSFWRPRRERRRAALTFDRVLGARSMGIPRDKPDEVLALLAVRFFPTSAPAGTLELLFSGGGAVALEVECIEVRLADLGAAWEATSRPSHKA
jgi:hypothetical protein